MSSTSDTLGLRRRPTQARSAATFDALLACAGSLLETRGIAAFSTNLLAEESGISVRAIYRYFPNKRAILVELARQLSDEWLNAVSAIGDLGDPSQAWEPIWRGYLDAWVRAVVTTPGGRAVIAATRDDPELRAIDDEINERYIDGIAAALRQRTAGLDTDRSVIIARVLMRSTIGVLDEAVFAPDTDRIPVIDELYRMHVHYLRDALSEESIHVHR